MIPFHNFPFIRFCVLNWNCTCDVWTSTVCSLRVSGSSTRNLPIRIHIVPLRWIDIEFIGPMKPTRQSKKSKKEDQHRDRRLSGWKGVHFTNYHHHGGSGRLTHCDAHISIYLQFTHHHRHSTQPTICMFTHTHTGIGNGNGISQAFSHNFASTTW